MPVVASHSLRRGRQSHASVVRNTEAAAEWLYKFAHIQRFAFARTYLEHAARTSVLRGGAPRWNCKWLTYGLADKHSTDVKQEAPRGTNAQRCIKKLNCLGPREGKGELRPAAEWTGGAKLNPLTLRALRERCSCRRPTHPVADDSPLLWKRCSKARARRKV